MLKTISIFFLTLYLFAATEVGQLLKLPIFFEHYIEHQNNDKGISLMEFLNVHYLHGSPKDDDYERDMQLPFKTPVHATNTLPNFVFQFPDYYIVPKAQFITKKKILFYNVSTYPYQHLTSIWQPPRFC